MSRYRTIDVRMHGDEKFRSLTRPQPNGRSLWYHLLTGPSTGPIPGLYSCGEMAMAEELNWPIEGFRKAFREPFAKGMVKADWDARLIWVPNAVRYNPPANPNVVKSWRSPWDELPECALKIEAWHVLKEFTEGLGKGFGEAFLKVCPKGMAKQEQDQEQDQEQEREQERAVGAAPFPLSPSSRRPGVEDVFEHYVLRFPKRRGQAQKPDTLDLISGRLATHTAEDLKRAIDGCIEGDDGWYARKGLTELKRIMKDDESVDKFLALADAPETPEPRRPNRPPTRAELLAITFDDDEEEETG